MGRTLVLAAVAAMMTVSMAHANTCAARQPTHDEVRKETAPPEPMRPRDRPHYNTWVGEVAPVPMPRPKWRDRPVPRSDPRRA